MAQDKSVSGSLNARFALPTAGIVAIDAVIGGESAPIIISFEGPKPVAWLNICPHQGRRLDYAPGKFLVEKDSLICAAHGASFRLTDGECVAGPCRGSSLREVAVSVNDQGELVFGPLR